MISKKTVKVAVSAATYAIDRLYEYHIPESYLGKIDPGTRVVVPFGRGNRKCEAIVLSVQDLDTDIPLKTIDSILDNEPILTKEQIKLALWMRDRVFCTVYDAVHAMIPSGLWYKDGGIKVKDKTEAFLVLNVPPEDAANASEQKRKRAPMQASILDLMVSVGHASLKEVLYFTGASRKSANELVRQGYLSIENVEVYRRPKYTVSEKAQDITLNEKQQAVFDGLLNQINTRLPSAALLFGVTGSGKTSIYIKLIKEIIGRGKKAILLVPEIALTPQLVNIFSSHFGDDIAVLHSSLGIGERYDEWKRIKSGAVNVVIGTRSAVFAPVDDLGIIIIDEEQEATYKSESSPRYHARDVAKYRCVQSKALLLMGSATPSVDSMYSAESGKYTLYTLSSRYNAKKLPDVIIADMKDELRSGNGSYISGILKKELENNIAAGQQSILFINRRGASSQVVCGECGYIYSCENCSVAMTYHSMNGRLMCHYCGKSVPVSKFCPQCGGQLKFVGVGTQKIQEELQELFPDITVLRMDTDTVSPAYSHEKILTQFRDENIPILVGTQMVAKGLDFENVTLVGVILADQSLYVNDYRAYERTFSMITQVVGRSGRGDKPGRAVIQTFTPKNEIIKLASIQDYLSFYEREIASRQLMECPPIKDLFVVNVSGQSESSVMRGCVKLCNSFEHYFSDLKDVKVLGPAPAPVVKVNNKYRYRVTVSAENRKRIRDTVAHLIREFSKDKTNRGLTIYADVNPAD